MRVSRDKAAENREKILHSASRLFREKGFDGIGVAELMKDAGLTHGGFYGHFASKGDLVEKACADALEKSAQKWERLAERAPEAPAGAIVRSYLSGAHRDHPGHGCLLAALGADVGRQEAPVRRTFAEGLEALAGILAPLLPGGSEAERRDEALATIAGLVGAIVLARAVGDETLSEEILVATARQLVPPDAPGGKAGATPPVPDEGL